jgi:hypothetical protein
MTSLSQLNAELNDTIKALRSLDAVPFVDLLNPADSAERLRLQRFVARVEDMLRTISTMTGDVAAAARPEREGSEIGDDRTARLYAAGCVLDAVRQQLDGARQVLAGLRQDLAFVPNENREPGGT